MPFPPAPRAIIAKRHLLAKASFLPKSITPYTSRSLPATPSRSLTSTPQAWSPRKGSEDRESINTEPTEYSKSGTDSQAAERKGAFDPERTRPEEEKEGGNNALEDPLEDPLEVSPANPEVSKPRGETEGGAEGSGEDNAKRGSGFGSPQKNGDGEAARKN